MSKTISLSKIRKVHFIGIGGIGMSALARFMLHEGKDVSGSDASESELVKDLKEEGVVTYIGHQEDHINKDIDLVVYTIAVQHSNPELVKAKEIGVSTVSYPEMLGVISRDKYTIAIAGTHGKTTTTAMLAQILCDAGRDPIVVVGSLLDTSIAKNSHGGRTNFIYGNSDIFIVEACEYKRSFLHLSPDILAITNIDADHLDYYKGLEDIQSAFREISELVPKDGYVVCNPNNEKLKAVIRGLDLSIIDYSNENSSLQLNVPGDYNKENARVALSIAGLLDINIEKSLSSLSKFKGTWRRSENICEFNGGLVFDDYAHHPTEIKASIIGFKEKFPDKELIVIFQPHLYSRTKLLLSDFVRSLSYADEIIVLPIYAAREVEDPSISSQMLVEAISEEGKRVRFIDSRDKVLDSVKNKDLSNSIVLTMGAGDVYKIVYDLCNGG